MTKSWTWWQGGIALGVLSALAMVILKPLGTSTFFPSSLAILLKSFAPDFVAQNAYFQTQPLKIGAEHLLVLGIPLGAYIAYRLSGEKKEEGQPEGDSSGLGRTSPILAFVGGFLVLFGARMANGCTTGHVLGGMTQLSVSGFLFAAAVFAGGIPAALMMKRRVR